MDEVEATWTGVRCLPKQAGAVSEECDLRANLLFMAPL